MGTGHVVIAIHVERDWPARLDGPEGGIIAEALVQSSTALGILCTAEAHIMYLTVSSSFLISL